MKRRPVEDAELPIKLTESLNKDFVDVMFYRFEFARGCSETPDVSEAFGWDFRTRRPRLFKRIHARQSFLAREPGRSAYLDDLRKDLSDAGGRREEALRLLKAFVENRHLPLCEGENFTNADHQEPFFPRADYSLLTPGGSQAVRRRTRAYCFQLFELQDFLIREVGVEPGSLLPLWVSREQSRSKPELPEDDLPIVSYLPVRQGLIRTLADYVAWEYGGWLGNPTRNSGDQGRSKRTVNKTRHLDLALRLSRVAGTRAVRALSLLDATGIDITKSKGIGQRRLDATLARLRDPDVRPLLPPEDADGFVEYVGKVGCSDNEALLADLLTHGFERDWVSDERLKARLPADLGSLHAGNLKKNGSPEAALMNSTQFRNLLARASKYGARLHFGDYVNLW